MKRIEPFTIMKFILILTSLFILLPASAWPVDGIRVYQKTTLEKPLARQAMISADLNRYYNAGDIWTELRHEFALPHDENNPRVQQKIRWYYQHPNYLQRTMLRAAPWLYFVLQQTHKRHLPAELVLLPIIESAYDPFAKNESSGAAGMWQMQTATASDYGIRPTAWYDGRYDVVSSTRAALDHLAFLRTLFSGNWLLAIAAYDAGQGKIGAAIRHNLQTGDGIDYWSLSLTQETEDYVPQLLALATIISHPELSPISFPSVPNAPYLAAVNTGISMNLSEAANLARLSPARLRALNPGYRRDVTLPATPARIVIPIGHLEQFTENLNKLVSLAMLPRQEDVAARDLGIIRSDNLAMQQTVSDPSDLTAVMQATLAETHASEDRYAMQPGDTLYIVRNNDTLRSIAHHYHRHVKELVGLNGLPNATISAGQRLIIPTHLNLPAQQQQLDQLVADANQLQADDSLVSQPTPAWELSERDKFYVVRHHDTLQHIAQHFHTTPSAIRLANLMMNDNVMPGDRLVIPARV